MNYADCDSPGQGFARIAGPWTQASDWSVYGELGCDWLSQDTRSQGVTFILQELRSPGGLIERCSLNFAAECINQDKT